MVIAGEVSGDLHGSALINAIKEIDPSIKLTGIGGNLMQKAGMDLIYHIRDMAFLGFTEVVKHLPFIKKVQRELLRIVQEENISRVVLIDYPGFNLNIAPKLKEFGTEVYYYISPQIWAWGQGRVKKIKKYIDKMIVLFPFEKEFYAKEGIDVEYVGHPLVERMHEYKFLSKDELFQQLNLDGDKEILLIMPGSRTQEVERIFPEVIKAAKRISEKYSMQIVIAGSENIDDKKLKSDSTDIDFVICRGNNYDLLAHSKFGIIKSGTSTLEAGYLRLPGLVVYKTGELTFRIGKTLAKVDNIAMTNIIAGETVLPELLQSDVKEQKIFEEADRILGDVKIYQTIKEKLSVLKNKLGEPGASMRAAKIITTGFNES